MSTVLRDPDGQFIGLTVGRTLPLRMKTAAPAGWLRHHPPYSLSELVGIEAHLYAPRAFGGQKRRVSLAGVMVGSGQDLLFDEPLANLDPIPASRPLGDRQEIQKGQHHSAHHQSIGWRRCALAERGSHRA